LNDRETQDYYDKKVRRAEETLMLFAKVVFVTAVASVLYALIAR